MTKKKKGARVIKKTLSVLLILFLALLCELNYVFPIKHLSYVEKYSQEFNLDTALVLSIINTESKFNEQALSVKDARGLMQLLPSTANWGAQSLGIDNFNEEMLYDIETNIHIGCWYLDKLLKQYNGNVTTALCAYNAGSGNVARWLKNEQYSSDGITLEKIPYPETESYVKKINLNLKYYSYILELKNNVQEIFKPYIGSDTDSVD